MLGITPSNRNPGCGISATIISTDSLTAVMNSPVEQQIGRPASALE
jgi:hypothetical protein